MKYVMLEVALSGEMPPFKLPIIFPDKLIHKDMAVAARNIAWGTWPRCSVNVVSAGEINLGAVECFGSSETLKVESREDRDARVIETYNYTHGVEL